MPETTVPQETTTTPSSTAPLAPGPSTAASSSSSGTSPWVWLLVGLGALALVAGLILLLRRRSQRAALQAWRAESRAALDAAQLALGLVPASPGGVIASEKLQSVRRPLEQAADGMDRVSSRAPIEEGRGASLRAAEALRGLVFALEASVILRESATPPTGDQLMGSDTAARARRAEAQAALEELDRLIIGTSPSEA